MKALKRLLAGAAIAVALGGTALAETRLADAPAFTVIEADASIPFSQIAIRSYEVADDRSLLIRVGANRWYRATVWQPCRSHLRFENSIGFVTRGTDTFDRFSQVIVDGHRCPISTLDRIEDPRRGQG